MSDRNDAEKRWHDPQAFHAAVVYVVSVVAVAAVAFALYALPGGRSVYSAVLVPAIVFGGGLGAIVKTYRVWKAGGTWPIWQGAAWFLFALFLVCLSIPGTAMLAR